MTKTEFCESIVRDFETTELEGRRKVDETDIMNSSSLAVAMEHLQLLKDPGLVRYAASRAGVVRTWIPTQQEYDSGKRAKILSVRQLLDLLPQ